MSDVMTRIVGIEPGSRLAEAVAARADVIQLTQSTHDAALNPADPGGLSHVERAALACRIARLNGERDFQDHFESLMERAGSLGATAQIADLDFHGGNERLKAIVRHVDLVAKNPKAATGNDIALLQAAGISDADIVRLSELVAFVSYQIRVAAGLRLMRGLT